MTNSRGPVVVGMDTVADDTASMLAALDLAAREAVRRQVELRLVYGHEDLPRWGLTCAALDRVVSRTAAAHPALAITTAIYPGTAANALISASATAGLVVLAAETRLDDGDVIASLLASTTLTRAPVVMIVSPQASVPTDIDRHREPALAGATAT